MESLLLLAAWMSMGAASALRFGPSGAIPVAVIFGPFWLAIVEDMSGTQSSVHGASLSDSTG